LVVGACGGRFAPGVGWLTPGVCGGIRMRILFLF
jgi:hypothetical protein